MLGVATILGVCVCVTNRQIYTEELSFEDHLINSIKLQIAILLKETRR